MTTQAASRIVGLARKVLNERSEAGFLDIVVRCREIAGLYVDLAAHVRYAPEILTVVGIASETDDFSVDEERRNRDPDALAEKDRELAAYMHEIEDLLRVACRAIVRRLGN